MWVAGNGPYSRRVTGEVADGWMPIGLFLKVYEKGRKEIAEVIKKEGRDLEKFTFGIFQRIYINDDEEKLTQQIQMNKMGLALQPRVMKELGYWKEEFDQIYCDATGFACDEMSLLKYDRDDVAKFDVNKLEALVDHIPDKEVRENVMFGSGEEIIKKVQKYIDVGAQYFIFEIVNGASSKNAPFTYWDVTRILSEEVIPQFK